MDKQCKAKREVAKGQRKAYVELYEKSDNMPEELRKSVLCYFLRTRVMSRAVQWCSVQYCRLTARRSWVQFWVKESHFVFAESEKAHNRVLKEELWHCMRMPGMANKYVRLVEKMYESTMIVVRCVVGVSDGFKVEVGLHHGSTLSQAGISG